MSKIAVVFWSGTGNTEEMANAVLKGAQDKGAEAVLFTAADFSADKAEDFDAVYDAGLQNILNSGAQQMIEEFRQAYKDGNFRGVFPGNL